MRPTAMTTGSLAVFALAAALAGCDRRTEVSGASSAASENQTTENGPPLRDAMIGDGRIVADTTFASSSPAGPSAEDRLLGVEPTSAGLPVASDRAGAAQQILSEADRRFLSAAVDHSAYDLALARLVFDRAPEPEVKLFADRLAAHHQSVHDTLLRLAAHGGLALGEPLSAPRRAEIDRLTHAPARDLDARLLDTLGIASQQADIELYERALDTVDNARLRDFIQGTLPSLHQNLAAAEQLRRARVGASTTHRTP